MIEKVVFYYETEGRKFRITANAKQFDYILKWIKDYNQLLQYLETAATWEEEGGEGEPPPS